MHQSSCEEARICGHVLVTPADANSFQSICLFQTNSTPSLCSSRQRSISNGCGSRSKRRLSTKRTAIFLRVHNWHCQADIPAMGNIALCKTFSVSVFIPKKAPLCILGNVRRCYLSCIHLFGRSLYCHRICSDALLLRSCRVENNILSELTSDFHLHEA